MNPINLKDPSGADARGCFIGVTAYVGSVATAVAGFAILRTPEPTGLTKVGGYATLTIAASANLGALAQIDSQC